MEEVVEGLYVFANLSARAERCALSQLWAGEAFFKSVLLTHAEGEGGGVRGGGDGGGGHGGCRL